MLKHNLLIVSIFILTFAFSFQIESTAKDSFVACSDSTIVINPLPLPNANPPKAPAQTPISASYNSTTTSVALFFIRNLGEIEVEVLNSTTGGFCSDFIDTQYLYAISPITLGPGHYIITFTLPSGQQFQGDFYV